MADNRMWLIHKPTRLGILLGKRLGLGWYPAPMLTIERLAEFYSYLKDHPEGSQDDFVLWMENKPGWTYANATRGGFRKFKRAKGA